MVENIKSAVVVVHHPLFGMIATKIIPIDAEVAKTGEGCVVNLLISPRWSLRGGVGADISAVKTYHCRRDPST
jgi:hypothetical protein